MVTIDPDVAKEILGIEKEVITRASSSSGDTAGHQLKQDAPKVSGSLPHKKTGRQRDHATRPQNKITGRVRNNSLRHVKNSTEVLRQRPIRGKQHETSSESGSGVREGRQFTVGNVGNNGIIYLRPIAHPSASKPQPAVSVTKQSGRVQNHAPISAVRDSVWSGSQLSRSLEKPLPPTSYPPNLPPTSPAHARSRSYSTLDDQKSSESKEGVLKIVIDRSRVQKRKTAELPMLEIPIPTYRLGSPRFSASGRPVLRSSVYTRTSVSENRASSVIRPDFDTLFPSPPQLEFPRRQDEYFLHPDRRISYAYSGVTRSSAALPSPGKYSVKEPIEPEVYDTLATCMDDPSVVRFSPKTGEITAATPARIIAQISSESFMDYDLVSDFFLTFRSYLSCESVLNLLLARLKWAINRPQDDGRIIRIRTFAALRHWILNYFLDDFVDNHGIRLQFCDQINTMYQEVKARQDGGRSDLKILLDLKRCWNGRCSMVWESEDFSADRSPELDILPGGTEEDVDPLLNLQHVRLDRNSGVGVEIQDHGAVEGTTWFDITDVEGPGPHARQLSEVSANDIPISPSSEYSVQPISCSFPRALKRTPPPSRERGPHPVPLDALKIYSPVGGHRQIPQRPNGQSHKRSGSFTDSIRDDRGSTEGNMVAMFRGTGSLIRGRQFPPADAIVDVSAPLSPSAQISRFDLNQVDGERLQDATLKVGGPPMRTFMGSIRRVLSTRHGTSGQSQSGTASLSESSPSIRGKTSTLPLNIAYQNDASKDRKATPTARRYARIDLLCAEIHESYQYALSQTAARASLLADQIGIASGNETEQPSMMGDGEGSAAVEDTPRRMPSQLTSGSRSIVIVDDTGHTMPTMSGALLSESFLRVDPNEGLPEKDPRADRISTRPSGHRASSCVLGMSEATSAASPSAHSSLFRLRDANLQDEKRENRMSRLRRSSSMGASKRLDSLQSTSTTLRRYASYQSSISKYRPPPSLDTTISASNDSPDRHPTRLLRRRPGGDLRKFQNVHDLEPVVRPQSVASFDVATDSVAGSMLLMAARPRMETQQPAEISLMPTQKHVSMMRTHSSQRMRPSFEAVVKNFAEIPDDEDGGLEATLMKLEGTYERRSPDAKKEQDTNATAESSPPEIALIPDEPTSQSAIDEQPSQAQATHQSVAASADAQLRPEVSPRSRFRASFTRTVSPIFGTTSMSESTESYSSVPLLERGLRVESVSSPQGTIATDDSLPQPLFSQEHGHYNEHQPESSHPSIELVEETASMKRIPPGSAIPERQSQNHSFLLDDGDNISDLSSELSVDVIDYSEVQPRAMSPFTAPPGTALSGYQIPPHPLAHPLTPPFTGTTLDPMTLSGSPKVHQLLPLTPGPSPTIDQRSEGPAKETEVEQTPQPILPLVLHNQGHIPFVLAYDSETIAQQFTIVEKAALSEVDWSDLVDMKWDNKSPIVLNWVEYLREKEHRGIDLVTARFNLMVKWVVSEIVMTRDTQERARTLMKYIHIAAAARRIRNYATMLQIVIGLTSTDCTRLKKTWELVPGPDQRVLKDMETLIQPVRNFHALREEMESTDLQEGCIPFMGLYVHDLTYNAQKPAQIASTRYGEPLLNFERYRTAASIVKNLLRLIDLSSKYNYRPVEGAIQKCLWMAALPDHKIQALSQSLE